MTENNKAIKPNCCGKFRKKDEVIELWGEGNETWLECAHCCSDHDYKHYFEEELGKRNDRKQ